MPIRLFRPGWTLCSRGLVVAAVVHGVFHVAVGYNQAMLGRSVHGFALRCCSFLM